MGRVENEVQAEPSINTHVEENVRQLPKKIKILTAFVIFYGNVTFGCAFNTYGPVLTSLQHKYDTDDATISKVFTILTTCYMISALVGGIVYNYVNRQLAVIVILSVMATAMFVTPHCPTLITFFISAVVMGMTVGSYDTAQFVWMMEMMQKDCPPYVQGQHFAYALGTNLATLIMAPFLDEDEDDETTTTTGSLFNNKEYSPYGSLNSTGIMADDETSKSDKLFIPYTIVGCLVASSALFQILLFIFCRYFPPPPETSDVKDNDDLVESEEISTELQNQDKPFIGTWSWPKTRIIVLTTLVYGAYQAMEMTTFQFFSKFGQNSDLHLTESQAAYTLTGMTAAFAAGRGVAIVAVFKIATQYLVCGNIALCLVADIVLVGWALRSEPALWTAGIMFGLGFSSMYGSFSAYMERFLNFTNFVGSLMLVVGSGMAAIYPLIVGSFIENSPIVLSYVSFFSIFCLTILFGTIWYLTSRDKTRY